MAKGKLNLATICKRLSKYLHLSKSYVFFNVVDINDTLVYGKRLRKKKEAFFEGGNLRKSRKARCLLKDKEKWKKDRHKSR